MLKFIQLVTNFSECAEWKKRNFFHILKVPLSFYSIIIYLVLLIGEDQ